MFADDEAEADVRSDLEQTLADGDQTSSDLDQTCSDTDATSSERDQLASDRDQRAADQDQATSDRADDGDGDGEDAVSYARSREARSRSAAERDVTSRTRLETAQIRDQAASTRDRQATERDDVARTRDELSASLDAEVDRLELDSKHRSGGKLTGLEIQWRAAHHRKRAATSRVQAAVQRTAAARDRERALQDRRQAALDRAAAAEEFALEGVDYLTGSLRRRAGQVAIQREMDRTARTGESLAVAFIDVDGLKAVNDARGHAAGDELLRAVAERIRSQLRACDVIARFGGDEFVCSMSGQDGASARSRFDRIARQLAGAANPTTITVGLTERRPGDTLDELVRRADRAMIEAREGGGRQS